MNIFKTILLAFCCCLALNLSAQEDCDCPDPGSFEEFVCVEFDNGDGTTSVDIFPSACLAECLGFTVVDEGDCDFGEWEEEEWPDEEWPEDECDCDEPTEDDMVCVECVHPDGSITVDPFPSACLAECYGFTISDEDCDYGDWEEEEWPDEEEWPEDDCDCEDDDEIVCVEFDNGDGTVSIEPFPSACFAECLGLTVVDGDCDYGDWEEEEWPEEEECDCPEPTEDDMVCVECVHPDGSITVDPFPSACIAECYGFTISDEDCDYGDWGEEEWPEDECDCDEEEDMVCVEFDNGDGTVSVEPFPGACLAECLGLTVVDGDCDYGDWEEEEEWPEGEEEYPEDWDFECFDEIMFTDLTTFQGFLLALNEACDLELSDCILNAPLFDTDEEFIEYVEANCDDFFGLIVDTEGNEIDAEVPFQALFSNYSSATTTNVKDIQLDQINIVRNPVNSLLEVNTVDVNVKAFSIFNMNGQMMSNIKSTGNATTHQISVDALNSGMYLLQVHGENATRTLKFVVAK